ncbi:MAG: hypothetical protein RLZZ230_774 [Candidatus Parcubacteria bacterium]|jgi:hypothetical protein
MDNQPDTTIYESRPSVIPYIIIGVVVGALIGVFIGLKINSSNPELVAATDVSTSDEYKAGFEAARARLQERGMLPNIIADTNIETTYLSGKVKAVSANSLTVDVTPLDPLADIVERSIATTPTTQIFRLTNKTPQVMQAEMEAFTLKMKDVDPTTNSPTEFPAPFTKEKITITDIKSGDMVNIKATANITADGNIEASSLEVQSAQVSLIPPPVN